MMCGLKLDVGGIKIKLQINDYKPTSKKKSANRFKAGEDDGKEIIRNDFGGIVAVIPYMFNRTSILLARMVFRGRKTIEKNPFFK